jgi:DNA-binding MarR family transcriptional regulator
MNDEILGAPSQEHDKNNNVQINEQQIQAIATPRELINSICCCFNMRKVMRAVTQYYDKHLEKSGIRTTQLTLLIELSTKNAKTLTEIADNLVMDRTTLTRNLKPLEKAGYITTLQPLDKRSKAYALTEKGQQVVNNCLPIWQTAQTKIVSSFGEEQYHKLLNDINTLIHFTNNHKDRN